LFGATLDEETLTFLLRGRHMNMPDRIARGLWPHPPLKYGDLLQHLTEILERETWFPFEWKSPINGEYVGESMSIERRGPRSFVCRAAGYHPGIPNLLTRLLEKEFRSARKAADFYLRSALHLPGDLDGWKVVK
jgi:hypothetical protein